MPSSTDSWGIEVGSHAIKAIRLQKAGGRISIAEFDTIPFKKVLTTPDLDVDEAIRLGLDQFLSRHPIGNAAVVASVPGHMAFARFAKLPPVEPKKVPDIVKFEAVQQIPFPIEQVEWDYQIFQHADSPDVEVGIFAITKERVASWLNNFHAVGLPVHAMTLSPVAAYNAIAYDEQWNEDSVGTIVMDIGTSATDLIIVESGRLWLRTIPLGGHHFTEALVRSFKLSYSKAEKIKKEAATSKYARQIFQAMRPVFVDMVNEVQKSIGYYQSLNRDADLQKLVGMGSTFRLPGLQKFLKQQLQLDVSRHDQFTRIDVEGRDQAQFSEHALEMAPAYGLALQGIEQEAVNCNVLPTVLIRQQVWRTKAPLNIAAAVLFSAAAVIGYSNLWSDRQAYYANAQLKGQAEAILKTAKDKQSKWTEIEGGSDPRSKIENLRRILDYRNVWPSVLTDVEQAIQATDPQPELLSSDVEAIKSIPRQTRRLVRVESINYEYESKNNDTTDIWGQRQNQTIDDYVTDVSEFQRPSAATTVEAADVAPSDPPTLIVRLVGTTTREDAPRFLNQTLIKYLNDKESQMREADRLHKENPIKHEDGRDRPYRITKVELKDLVPLLDARTRGTGGAAGRGAETERPGAAGLPGAEALPGVQGLPGVRGLPGATPARPRPGRLPGVRGLPGAGGGEFGEFGEFGPEYGDEFGGAGGRAARGATAELVTLLPGDPLAGEERNTDWRFVLEWRVELIRPEEARQVDQEAERSGPVASAEERQ